jgi:hypothetical protein
VKAEGTQRTRNICIEIVVEGVTGERQWSCGLEFDYNNEESFYCRPLRLGEGRNPGRMVIPAECEGVPVGFLPPMSGLAANETRLDPGAINVRLGEGRTAEVLGNLCFEVFSHDTTDSERWGAIRDQVEGLFGVRLDDPEYVPERGEIRMTSRDRKGVALELSSAGRGLQQTLLLLAYLSRNPGTVLLPDEPDAHLAILRARRSATRATRGGRPSRRATSSSTASSSGSSSASICRT